MDDIIGSNGKERFARIKVGSALWAWKRSKHHAHFEITRKPRNVFVTTKLFQEEQTVCNSSSAPMFEGHTHESSSENPATPTIKKSCLKKGRPQDQEESFAISSETGVETVQQEELLKDDENGDKEAQDVEMFEEPNPIPESKVDDQVQEDQLTQPMEEIDSETESMEGMKRDPAFRLIQIHDDVCLAVIDQKRIAEKTGFATLYKGAVKMTLIHGSLAVNGYDLQIGKAVKVCVGLASRQVVLFEKSRRTSTANGSALPSMIKAVQVLVGGDTSATKEIVQHIEEFIPNASDVGLVRLKKWDDDSGVAWTTCVGRQYFLTSSSRTADKESQWCEVIYADPKSSVGSSWDDEVEKNILSKMTAQSLVMVVGETNRGKSNLIKRMINRIMSAEKAIFDNVVYMDLDPGQSEFSVPAQVTAVLINTGKDSRHPILSDPCVNQIMFRSSIIASYSCGSINASSDPDAYVSSVKSLLNQVRTKAAGVPIFVNTIGFVNGLGRDMLNEIIHMSLPTHIIEIGCEDVPEGLSPTSYKFKKAKFSVKMGDFSASNVFSQHSRTWTCDHPARHDTEYVFLSLKSEKPPFKDRGGNIRRMTRTSQVYAALSDIPGILTSCMSFLPRKSIDLEAVVFHVSYDSAKMPMDSVVDSLDRSLVQLVKCKSIDEENLAPLDSRKIRMAYRVDEPEVIGHGILFVSKKDSLSQEPLKIEVVTSLHQESLKKVNCVLKAFGVNLTPDLIQDCCWN